MRLAASPHPAMNASSGTTFECRKNRSSRDRRRRCRLASIERRRIASISPGGGLPRLHLLVTRTPARQLAAERLAHDLLGLAVAVARRKVEQGDASRRPRHGPSRRIRRTWSVPTACPAAAEVSVERERLPNGWCCIAPVEQAQIGREALVSCCHRYSVCSSLVRTHDAAVPR